MEMADNEYIAFIVAVVAVTVAFLGVLGSCVAANLAWAPHAAEIRVQELQLQTACIQSGGINDGYGRCIYSKTAA